MRLTTTEMVALITRVGEDHLDRNGRLKIETVVAGNCRVVVECSATCDSVNPPDLILIAEAMADDASACPSPDGVRFATDLLEDSYRVSR